MASRSEKILQMALDDVGKELKVATITPALEKTTELVPGNVEIDITETIIINQVQETDETNENLCDKNINHQIQEFDSYNGSDLDEYNLYASSGSSYHPSEESTESENVDKNKPKDEEPNEIPKKRRRRKANKKEWKRSIVKELRISGKKYINRSGKEITEKSPLPTDCSKCRFKCQKLFSEEQRAQLCADYYSLADYTRQKTLLSSLIQIVNVSRSKQTSITKNRKESRLYHLIDNNGQRHRVCLKFFTAMFVISRKVVEKCVKEIMNKGIFVGCDKIKNSKPHNATAEIQRQQVKDHINSFPRIESHYCRRDSTKNYLNEDLNISIMYRLYQDFCTSNSLSHQSLCTKVFFMILNQL
ncbi:unnamed protein product [Diabrotica balteata]|uniref:Uncharacterized protein n=1 Tax=Diabrotica balteata TaxID=107213 RepID=A0A9N9SYD7_DIABA|nr:unnamed protein product [Diabrotica balteata]